MTSFAQRPPGAVRLFPAALWLCCAAGPAPAADAAADCPAETAQSVGMVTNQVFAMDLVEIDDERARRRAEAMLARLDDAGRPLRRPAIVVVSEPGLGSFSSADGTLYLSHELTALASDEELAFALAHELAHGQRCDHYQHFESVRSRRQMIVTGSAVAAVALMILTLGAGMAATGPLGAQTAASSQIINVGTSLAAGVANAGPNSARVTTTRPMLARSYMDNEAVRSPVYSPALFETVIKARYTGYGAPLEQAANQAALQRLQARGIAFDGTALARLKDGAASRLEGHLRAAVEEAQATP